MLVAVGSGGGLGAVVTGAPVLVANPQRVPCRRLMTRWLGVIPYICSEGGPGPAPNLHKGDTPGLHCSHLDPRHPRPLRVHPEPSLGVHRQGAEA